MKFNILDIIDNTKREIIDIIIKHNSNYDAVNLIDYINDFNIDDITIIVINEDNRKCKVKINDVLYFYSLKRKNYCKTNNGTFRIKGRLYSISFANFINISRTQIINLNHIKFFDTNYSRELRIIMDNNDVLFVSRRRIRDIIDYLDRRSV